MLVAWLIFSLVAFYTCIEPPCCGAGEVAEEEVITPVVPAAKDYALASRLGDGTVLQGDLWPELRNRLLGEYRSNPDQELEVYGYYYAGETPPAGYENMGFYRAEEIKKLLVPDIPADKIRPLAKLLEGTPPAADAEWNAGTFNWHTPDGGTEIIEIDDEITIRFPFDSDEKDPDPEVDEYLSKLAERLQQTQENVVITGHTDNVDTDAYNMRLGQRRADFIKRILVGHGAPEARITTKSQGESNPADTNATPEGRHNNRRAVVKLSASR